MSLPDSSILIARHPAVNETVRGAVALVCAASAGVHAALVPEHYREAGPPLATAFALSAVVLAVCAALSRRPRAQARSGLARVVVLSAVAGCYVLSRTTGLPGLVPVPEEPDALGVVTTAAEVLAAAAAFVLLRLDRKVSP